MLNPRLNTNVPYSRKNSAGIQIPVPRKAVKCKGENPLSVPLHATVVNSLDIGEFEPIETPEEGEPTTNSGTVPNSSISNGTGPCTAAATAEASNNTAAYITWTEPEQPPPTASCSPKLKHKAVLKSVDLLADSPRQPSRHYGEDDHTRSADASDRTCPMLDSFYEVDADADADAEEGAAVYIPHQAPLPATSTMYRWEDDMKAMEDRWHVLLSVKRIMECPGLLGEWVVLIATLAARGFDMSASARASADKDQQQTTERTIAPFRLKLREQTSGRRAEQQCLAVLSSLSLAATSVPALPVNDNIGFDDYAAAAEAACEQFEEEITSPSQIRAFATPTSTPVALGANDGRGIPCDSSSIEMPMEVDVGKPLDSMPEKSKDTESARAKALKSTWSRSYSLLMRKKKRRPLVDPSTTRACNAAPLHRPSHHQTQDAQMHRCNHIQRWKHLAYSTHRKQREQGKG